MSSGAGEGVSRACVRFRCCYEPVIMGQYHISRGGASLGVFPEAELRRALQAGQVLNTDLCWQEGMAEWRPVGEVVPSPGMQPPPLPPGAVAPPPPGPGYYPQQHRASDDAGMRMLLPVGRSAWAIIAGYLGLFCVLLIPGPLALICAFLGMRDIKNSKNTSQPKYGMGRVIFAFIMGALGTAGLLWWLWAVYLRGR